MINPPLMSQFIYSVTSYSTAMSLTGASPLKGAITCGVSTAINFLFLKSVPLLKDSSSDQKNSNRIKQLATMLTPTKLVLSVGILSTLGVQASLFSTFSLMATAGLFNRILQAGIIEPLTNDNDLSTIATKIAKITGPSLIASGITFAAMLLVGSTPSVSTAFIIGSTCFTSITYISNVARAFFPNPQSPQQV